MRMRTVIGIWVSVAGLVSSVAAAETPAAVPSAAERFRVHGVAEAPPKPDGMVRIATYNVHELFDDTDDPSLSGRNDDSGRTLSESRRVAVSDAIRRVGADVLAFQEVESLAALEWFRDGWLEDLGYEHAASIDVGHSIGLEQSVLSRHPIIETGVWTEMEIGVHPPMYKGKPSRYAGQPMTFRRSPLLVEVDLTDGIAGEGWTEADRVSLLVVHLKTGSGSDAWRENEARALIRIVDELRADRPERRVVMLGDFVGTVTSPHVRVLLGAGFTDVMGPEAAAEQSATFATGIDGNRECLILAAPGVDFAGGGFVLGTVAPPSKIRRDLAFGMPGFASDHYPVAADLAGARPRD